MAEHLVVNVSAQIAASLFREADEWRDKGELVNEQKCLDAARAQLTLAGLDSRECAEMKACERVPLTKDEQAERVCDAVLAAERAKTEAAAVADRQVLIDKLNAGEATNTETQQALAQLLGR